MPLTILEEEVLHVFSSISASTRSSVFAERKQEEPLSVLIHAQRMHDLFRKRVRTADRLPAQQKKRNAALNDGKQKHENQA